MDRSRVYFGSFMREPETRGSLSIPWFRFASPTDYSYIRLLLARRDWGFLEREFWKDG